MIRFVFVCLLVSQSANCRTKFVEFGALKMGDTAVMYPGNSNHGNLYYDSLVITISGKDSLKIFSYTAEAGNAFCDGVRTQLGLAYRTEKGFIGKLSMGDTVWEKADKFPDPISKIDSIPNFGYSMFGEPPLTFGPKYLGNLTATSTNHNSICSYPAWSLAMGYKQIIYYKSTGIFGKVQIYSTSDTTEANTLGVPITRFNRICVRYLFSPDQNDLAAPPIAIRMKKNKSPIPIHLIFASVPDILGRWY